jgi:hypothetical protein
MNNEITLFTSAKCRLEGIKQKVKCPRQIYTIKILYCIADGGTNLSYNTDNKITAHKPEPGRCKKNCHIDVIEVARKRTVIGNKVSSVSDWNTKADGTEKNRYKLSL